MDEGQRGVFPGSQWLRRTTHVEVETSQAPGRFDPSHGLRYSSAAQDARLRPSPMSDVPIV